jgi:hypothetical protein
MPNAGSELDLVGAEQGQRDRILGKTEVAGHLTVGGATDQLQVGPSAHDRAEHRLAVVLGTRKEQPGLRDELTQAFATGRKHFADGIFSIDLVAVADDHLEHGTPPSKA